MFSSKVRLYKNLFHKSFFFDKFLVKNVYQCPKITSLQIKFLISSSKLLLHKVQFAKLILFFHLMAGQCPQILIKDCNLRSTQRKKIIGLSLTLKNYAYFLNFLIYRQLTLLTPSYTSPKIFFQKTLTLKISHKIHDDDIFYQTLKLVESLTYQVTITSNSITKFHFQTLLLNFKIPCIL
jgi:hypothetical protein